jgi:hypothetical protein
VDGRTDRLDRHGEAFGNSTNARKNDTRFFEPNAFAFRMQFGFSAVFVLLRFDVECALLHYGSDE